MLVVVVVLLDPRIGHLVIHLLFPDAQDIIADVIYTTAKCLRFSTTNDKNTSAHTTHRVIVHFK